MINVVLSDSDLIVYFSDKNIMRKKMSYPAIVAFRLTFDERKQLDKAVRKLRTTKTELLRKSIKEVITPKTVKA